jgi:hypothetical protein
VPKTRRQIKEEIERIATKKGELRRRIERQLMRMDGLSNVEGSSILKEVEKQINAEGFMERIIDRRFTRQSERSTGGGRWQRLRPSTIRDRMRRGFPGARPILVRTGALYGGARAAVAGSFKMRGVRWNVGNIDVPYAKYHQSGGGKLPKRAFFNNPNADELKPALNRVRELVRMKIRELTKA